MRWVGVLLAAALSVTACTGQDLGSPEQTTTSKRPASSEASPLRLGCERPPKGRSQGDPVVPSGAVAARLCGGLVCRRTTSRVGSGTT